MDFSEQNDIFFNDFNINVPDYENNKNVQTFVNLMFEFSMIPTINKPTRVTSYTATAIDNIITNSIFDNDFESAIPSKQMCLIIFQPYLPLNLKQPLLLKATWINLYTNVVLTKLLNSL